MASRKPSNTHGSPAGLARAFAGAIIFALPLFMTMELWWLGFLIEPVRMVIMMVAFFPLLVALSHAFGFEETVELLDDVVDAFVALAVGFVAATIMLWLFGEIGADFTAYENIGKITVQIVPASIGALLARSLLGESEDEEETDRQRGESRYLAELVLMAGGALLLSFNIAPTEEVMLIAHNLENTHMILMVVISLALMHVFVYGSEFRGQHKPAPGAFWLRDVVRYSVVGYAVTLLLSGFVLWCFGRFQGMWPGEALQLAVVLAVPGSLGAGAARLVL